MLVSLSIKNFKSIREAHVRFGPVTCFIGHNGVGKSNLFDAIRFLSALADRKIPEAIAEVHPASDGGCSPIDFVFGWNPELSIELCASMIAPREAEDAFGAAAEPSTTLLTYGIKLGYDRDSGRLLVERESLTHAKLRDFRRFTGFETASAFRKSVALGGRRGGPLISTQGDRIQLHGDGGSRGRSAPVGKSALTVVGGTNSSDYPTVLAAKLEMSSWRVLHLQPSAMRTPDVRGAPSRVSAAGRHMPATLDALVERDPDATAEILFRLRQLNPDILDLAVCSDEVRDQLALRARVSGVDKWLHARSLSDGTLRYVALVLMLADTRDRAALCIEEPENGIHPSRVPNLVELLRDYAVDVDGPVAPDNPLRQVVLNSHSPETARQLSFGEIVFVERGATRSDGPISVFRPVAGEWRSACGDYGAGSHPIDRQAVVDFIGGSPLGPHLEQSELEFGSVR